MTRTQARYEMYLDDHRRWRWRYRGEEDIAQSSRGYVDRGDCLRAIACIRGSAGSQIHQVRLRHVRRPTRSPGLLIDFPA